LRRQRHHVRDIERVQAHLRAGNFPLPAMLRHPEFGGRDRKATRASVDPRRTRRGPGPSTYKKKTRFVNRHF
jgi:hypothetical protein